LSASRRRKDRNLLRESLNKDTPRKSMDFDKNGSSTLQVLEEMEEYADGRKSASFEIQSVNDLDENTAEEREKTSSL